MVLLLHAVEDLQLDNTYVDGKLIDIFLTKYIKTLETGP